MIPVPSGVRVWLAVGRTDMRRGMNGLALQVQEALGRDTALAKPYVHHVPDEVEERDEVATFFDDNHKPFCLAL